LTLESNKNSIQIWCKNNNSYSWFISGKKTSKWYIIFSQWKNNWTYKNKKFL